jgi:hypothetical protein
MITYHRQQYVLGRRDTPQLPVEAFF